MDRLLISLATRNRPQLLLETVKRSLPQWTHPNTRMVIQADADDYATLGMLTDTKLDPRVSVNVQKREDTVAEKWNRALKEDADVYLIAADDDPHITPGYDSTILEAAKLFPDGIGIVYGHLANASFSNVMAPTRKWCDLLGYILPEHFPYWFSDHWLDDIARITGRMAVVDVRGDQSKVPPTQEMREPAWWATWFDACYPQRRAEAFKVIDALDEPDWRKSVLRNSYPHVEFRSKWINDNVRAQSRGLEMAMAGNSLNDERYQRVKQKAITALPQILQHLPQDEAMRYAAMLSPPPFIVSPQQAFGPVRVA